MLDSVFSNDFTHNVKVADDVLIPCDRYHPALAISISLSL